jgi:hypothetical protein
MKQLHAWTIAALAATVASGCGGGGGAYVGKHGDELAIGKAAHVDLHDDPPSKGGTGKSGKLDVTLDKIEKGDAHAVAASGTQLKDQDVYYVHFTVKNTGGDDLAGTRLVLVSGLDDTGKAYNGTTVPEDFDGCPDAPAPDDFTDKGATYETCRVIVADHGTKITGANYVPGDIDTTIVWT